MNFPCKSPDAYLVSSKQEVYFVKEITKFSAQPFGKHKTRTEQWWATSGSYCVSWNFIRHSAILNFFAGWGAPEPQCSM